LEWVTGAALALRRSALDDVGLFDEGYSPAYIEDIDLCWRLRGAGYRVHYAPTATLRHGESRSTTDRVRLLALANRNRLRFVLKTFPTAKIWDEFVVAERARLALLAHGIESRFLLRTYLEGILQTNEWLAARADYYPVSSSDMNQLGRLCAGLRRDLVASVRGRGL
jgi:GT2 family glycosyltransferase